MPPPVTVDILDRMRPSLASLVRERAKRLSGMRYCDLRIEVREDKGALAENGNEKASAEDYVFDFGVRAIAGARKSASGFYGRILGAADADNIESVVWDGIRRAHQRARPSSRLKRATSGRLGSLGQRITGTDLAPVPVVQDTVPAIYDVDPRTVQLADSVRMAVDGCKAVQGQNRSIVYAAASVSTFLLRELYLSSEGADIGPELRPDRRVCHRRRLRGTRHLRVVRLHRPPTGLGDPIRRLRQRTNRLAQFHRLLQEA